MWVVYNEFDLLAESPSKGRGPKKTLKSLVSCQTPLGLLLNQFTFAKNRPKSDSSGVLGPIHYITSKALGPSVKHVLGVLEWSYVVSEKPFFSSSKIEFGFG